MQSTPTPPPPSLGRGWRPGRRRTCLLSCVCSALGAPAAPVAAFRGSCVPSPAFPRRPPDVRRWAGWADPERRVATGRPTSNSPTSRAAASNTEETASPPATGREERRRATAAPDGGTPPSSAALLRRDVGTLGAADLRRLGRDLRRPPPGAGRGALKTLERILDELDHADAGPGTAGTPPILARGHVFSTLSALSRDVRARARGRRGREDGGGDEAGADDVRRLARVLSLLRRLRRDGVVDPGCYSEVRVPRCASVRGPGGLRRLVSSASASD